MSARRHRRPRRSHRLTREALSDDPRLEVTPHIDGADIEKGLAEGEGLAGLKTGFAPAGRVKLKLMPCGSVEVSWSSNSGRAWDSQLISLIRFKHDGVGHVCLGCKVCRRPRNRLFLVQGGRSPIERAYCFLCADCGGLEQRKLRRGQRKRPKKPRVSPPLTTGDEPGTSRSGQLPLRSATRVTMGPDTTGFPPHKGDHR
jgi:hypothetical protein